MKTKYTQLWGFSAVLAAAALVTFAYTAVAQEKAAKKPASACKGLDEASCKTKDAVCHWIGEITTKAGKTRKAHCRTRVKSPKKKDAPK